MNEERENEIIKEFESFKNEASSIHKKTEYTEEYDFYNKNALFYVMAEYMEGEELTREEMYNAHPIHYEYNHFGNSTFDKFKRKYLLHFEWYNQCIGVLTKADITEFTEELTNEIKNIKNEEVEEIIKEEEAEYKEHCFNELVKSINEEYLKVENNKSKMFNIPIEKIENIKCSFYVEMFKSHYFIRVNVDNINERQSFLMNYYINDIFDKQDLKNILKKIENLKYDNLNGKFYDKIEFKIMGECFNTLLKNMENVITTYKECIVCYKQTKTKTPCKHFLCTECVQSMSDKEELEEAHEEGITLKCPICRNEFYDLFV
jgi:hypothetical protein